MALRHAPATACRDGPLFVCTAVNTLCATPSNLPPYMDQESGLRGEGRGISVCIALYILYAIPSNCPQHAEISTEREGQMFLRI